MGTGHRQEVITKDGEMKIQQYGQWDGYPDGQGLGILKYLKSGNLSKYQENLSKIPLIDSKQIEEVSNTEGWSKVYPYLSRDCGSDIHQMIEDGVVRFVYHTDIEICKEWCDGFYTIDFKKNIFTSDYYDNHVEFKLDDLPTEEEYLSRFKFDEE